MPYHNINTVKGTLPQPLCNCFLASNPDKALLGPKRAVLMFTMT
jgi:hypothetical protein